MGELEEIELIYSFTVRDSINAPAATSTLQGGSDRYVKLRVGRDEDQRDHHHGEAVV